jgi:hypothetical protein
MREYVHHDVAVVHQHPAGFFITLDVVLLQAQRLAVDCQRIGYGFDVGVGCAAADDEVVG